jgi:wyosine [tRNA(Phe)-imidazoG37] synthetase (radical SAM superfamily)
MKHVFGPVPSRRLGRSLGIDPVPLKTCNYSCVYCQLGITKPLTNKRKAFFSASEIMAEVATTLDHSGSDSIDWITFVGSGETALNSRLGSLIRFTKSISDLPVAVITNGSLLHLPEVREDLCAADAVLPSLDAGNDRLYARINRPHHDFSFAHNVEGLIQFRREFDGQMWVEVMLLGNVNDSPEDLFDIAEVLAKVEPDEIHISTPTRPPAEPWVELPSEESLERASSIFGGVTRVLRPIEVEVETDVEEELVDAILTVVSRHPMQEMEVVRSLARWVPGRVLESLTALANSGEVRVIERHGKRFWCSVDTEFPDENTAFEVRPQFFARQRTTSLSS